MSMPRPVSPARVSTSLHLQGLTPHDHQSHVLTGAPLLPLKQEVKDEEIDYKIKQEELEYEIKEEDHDAPLQGAEFPVLAYGTQDWAPVPQSVTSRLPPPATLSRIIPNYETFDHWLLEWQHKPVTGEDDDRLRRLRRDARLLAALRECRAEYLDQHRRLQDVRALAIQTLRSPFIRHLSRSQGVDLRVSVETPSDVNLLASSHAKDRDPLPNPSRSISTSDMSLTDEDYGSSSYSSDDMEDSSEESEQEFRTGRKRRHDEVD
ncbi:unnamed protein product [Peniophora sp. CBMAI 1063]|nr:unnamed protein product [Peniophora sp. CBMAI 1063]